MEVEGNENHIWDEVFQGIMYLYRQDEGSGVYQGPGWLLD